jgi:hypothetical protein
MHNSARRSLHELCTFGLVNVLFMLNLIYRGTATQDGAVYWTTRAAVLLHTGRQTNLKSNSLITGQFEDRVFNSIRTHGLAKPICLL